MTANPETTISSEELARELRIHDAVEGSSAINLVAISHLVAYIAIFSQTGLAILMGPAAIPLAVSILLISMGYRSYLKLKNRPRPKDVSTRRLRTLAISALLLGMSWGAFVMITLPGVELQAQIVILLFAYNAGLASVGVNSIRIALPFGMSILLMTWIAMLWVGLLSWWVTSLIFALSIAAILQFILQARQSTIENVKIALESRNVLKERLAAEEKLHHAEVEAARAEKERATEISKMQRDLINTVAFPMMLSHKDQILETTPRALGQFVIDESQLDAVAFSDLFAEPGDHLAVEEILQTSKKLDDHEVMMKSTDGSRFWVTLSVRPLLYDGKECRLYSIYVIDARKRMEQDLADAKEAAEEALTDLKTAQESLIHSEKMASLGALTAGIAHEIKNPLNFVNNFSKISAEMMDELVEIIEEPLKSLDEEDFEDSEDLIDTIRGNMQKIEEHGKRADSIVRNMLHHSREGTGETQQVELNQLASEALNLAYHGARATDKSFNVELESQLSDEVGLIECEPQELQRVILNLCTNAMYEASRHARQNGHEPKVTLKTTLEGDQYRLDVTDNGAGVPEDIRDKIFQPFFTTKPTGEGTGLGLSMSYDIIKQHEGQLSLESDLGKGATFTIHLPRQ